MTNIHQSALALTRKLLAWYDRAEASDDELEQIITQARDLVQESEPSEQETENHIASPGKYVLYDFDLDELATTEVYASYSDAAADAAGLNNVLILKLPIYMGESEQAEECDQDPRCDG